MSQKIAVVGAGLSGLSAALRLAKKGYRVSVFEKNSGPGGKASLWQQQGFSFDTGPSLLTMKFVLDELFAVLGLRLEDYLKLVELSVLCKYFYADGRELVAYSNGADFAREVEKQTTDTAKSVAKFLDYARQLYDVSADLFLLNEFRWSKVVSPRFLWATTKIGQLRPWNSMAQVIDQYFQDPATRQIFYRYATYNGSSPFLAPAFLNTIAHVEHNLGAWLPEGGVYELPRQLVKIGEGLGVEFYFDTSVDRLLGRSGVISGVEVKGRQEKFAKVVYAGDYWNLPKILPGFSLPKPEVQDLSTSAVLFYWGVRGEHSQLDLHNILFSQDYAQEFAEIFGGQVPSDPTVYVNVTSKLVSSAAPQGHENWFVMVNTPPDSGQDWQKIARELKKKVLQKVRAQTGIDLGGKIVVEKVVTPVDLAEESGAYRGSLYGLNSNYLGQILRPRARVPGYFNLFVAGGSVYPGGGMPLAILSGKFAAERVGS